MIVFILFAGYEDVAGVFSTRDKAEAHIAKLISEYKGFFSPGRRDHYSILEKTLNQPNEDD